MIALGKGKFYMRLRDNDANDRKALAGHWIHCCTESIAELDNKKSSRRGFPTGALPVRVLNLLTQEEIIG